MKMDDEGNTWTRTDAPFPNTLLLCALSGGGRVLSPNLSGFTSLDLAGAPGCKLSFKWVEEIELLGSGADESVPAVAVMVVADGMHQMRLKRHRVEAKHLVFHVNAHQGYGHRKMTNKVMGGRSGVADFGRNGFTIVIRYCRHPSGRCYHD
jgi:hypothetical protein